MCDWGAALAPLYNRWYFMFYGSLQVNAAILYWLPVYSALLQFFLITTKSCNIIILQDYNPELLCNLALHYDY